MFVRKVDGPQAKTSKGRGIVTARPIVGSIMGGRTGEPEGSSGITEIQRDERD